MPIGDKLLSIFSRERSRSYGSKTNFSLNISQRKLLTDSWRLASDKCKISSNFRNYLWSTRKSGSKPRVTIMKPLLATLQMAIPFKVSDIPNRRNIISSVESSHAHSLVRSLTIKHSTRENETFSNLWHWSVYVYSRSSLFAHNSKGIKLLPRSWFLSQSNDVDTIYYKALANENRQFWQEKI